MTNNNAFLTTKELAELLGLKDQTVRLWRLKGEGPKYIRLGKSVKAPVVYRQSDVEEWLEQHTFQHTAEEQAS